MTADEARETIGEMTDGKMADVLFDITGHPAVLGPALSMTKQLGKLVMIGTAARPELQCLSDDLVVRGIELIGSHVGNAPKTECEHNRWTRANGVDLFFNYLDRGLMDVEPLISHRFNPHEAPEAFDRLLSERTEFMGVLFDWTQLAK